MVRVLVLSLACVLVPAASGAGQAPAAATDEVARLLARIETMLMAGSAAEFPSLLSPNASPDILQQFAADLFPPDVTRAVVRERDRQPLQGALPGDGYRLVVEFFVEAAARARIVTARLDVRRPRAATGAGAWRIAAAERLTVVDGLHRLALDGTKQFAARALTITAEDLELVLHDGSVFPVLSGEGVTGLVLLGRGEMRFAPTPETERGQVRIFSGEETLNAAFETAFVRFNPAEYERRVSAATLTPVAVNARLQQRAQDVFAAESAKSFSLDLADLSRDAWHLLPSYGDFLAEVRTRKHGTLTYARATGEAEDVSLFDRSRQRNIALYASKQKLEARGRFYNEDELVDYDVLAYEIDAAITPDRSFLDARARIRILVKSHILASLTLRLAERLTITSIASLEHGRLLHLRVRHQNSVVVNLPVPASNGQEFTLLLAYSGRVQSQTLDAEVAAPAGQPQRSEDVSYVPPEPHLLLSNRSYWYPQAQVTDYATATLRITVPEPYGCVASGEPAAGSPATTRDRRLPEGTGRLYTFNALDPVRYIGLIVSRFVPVNGRVLGLVNEAASSVDRQPVVHADGTREAGFRVRDRVLIGAQSNPRQQGRARDMVDTTSDIVRFYASLMGEAPYTAVTLAMVEHELPGGHSPGYVVVLNNPLPTTPFAWRNDPATFSSFPEFFAAHELAHQWWGQAVGWKNYHEQWISEGFAQYFAALYAREKHGEGTFHDMLRQFRRWALDESDQGPIHLGYRLGHIKGDSRVFRALLYNKGAAVLHMLRRLVGDDTFFRSLRRFYEQHKFQKAGTDDLRRAFEEESGLELTRFFERWIYGFALPRIRYEAFVSGTEVVVRFRQPKDLVFDVPVTVTITYAGGRAVDVVVPVTDSVVERRIPTDGPVRQVQVNRDSAAIAHFDEGS